MTIQTTLDIGSPCYFLYENKIHKSHVSNISILVDSTDPKIYYTVEETSILPSLACKDTEIAPSIEALLELLRANVTT